MTRSSNGAITYETSAREQRGLAEIAVAYIRDELLRPANPMRAATAEQSVDGGYPVDEQAVDHPPHYIPQDPTYETIKVIEAWNLGFHLGNAVKYISRAGKKGDAHEDLRKARWYLDREIQMRQAGDASS